MYSIVGVFFCILEGVLVAKFGWTALLWSPIGFIIGLFISANIVLPIFMGVPMAMSHVSKKEMKSGVYLALFRAPIIWTVLIFFFAYFFQSGYNWVLNNETLFIGLIVGFIAILLSPLSKKARTDFRSDFDKSYGKYYTDQPNFNLGFTDIKDKAQLKQIEAITTIYSNLYIHDISTFFDVLNLEYPNSRFRHMIFCLSTTIKACEGLITSQELLQKECLHFLSALTTSKENVNEYFGEQMTSVQAENDGTNYLDEYLQKWENYYADLKSGDKSKATETLATIIYSVGTDKQIKVSDKQQLSQLCSQLEFTLSNETMRGAFTDLLARKN